MSPALWIDDGSGYPVGSETQLDSLERTKEKVQTHRDEVLEVIKASGSAGLCAAEVAEMLGWDQHWASPRITELKKNNQVKESGRPPRWNAKSQRFQTVWVVTGEASP